MRALPIHDPCHERLPRERDPHCEKCDKTVFDLSARTEDETRALLAAHGVGARICVRYARDSRGDVRFRAAAMAAAVTLAACSAPERETRSVEIGPVAPAAHDAGWDDSDYLLGDITIDAESAGKK